VLIFVFNNQIIVRCFGIFHFDLFVSFTVYNTSWVAQFLPPVLVWTDFSSHGSIFGTLSVPFQFLKLSTLGFFVCQKLKMCDPQS